VSFKELLEGKMLTLTESRPYDDDDDDDASDDGEADGLEEEELELKAETEVDDKVAMVVTCEEGAAAACDGGRPCPSELHVCVWHEPTRRRRRQRHDSSVFVSDIDRRWKCSGTFGVGKR
jgi:hypothetical protein